MRFKKIHAKDFNDSVLEICFAEYEFYSRIQTMLKVYRSIEDNKNTEILTIVDIVAEGNLLVTSGLNETYESDSK